MSNYTKDERIALGKAKHQLRLAAALRHIQETGDRPRISNGKGNAKLKKTLEAWTHDTGLHGFIGAFNLQAIITCPGADKCKLGCYATVGNYNYHQVWMRRYVNQIGLGKTQNTMYSALLDALQSWYFSNKKLYSQTGILRLHDSGDLFGQTYVNALAKSITTVRARMDAKDDLIVYGYTKSLHLDLSPLWRAGVRLAQSLGGKHDRLIDWSGPVAAIVPRHSDVTGEWVDANGDLAIQDLSVINGHRKIALTFHGSGNGKQWKSTEDLDGLIQIGERVTG
jgi:hypothetical protein